MKFVLIYFAVVLLFCVLKGCCMFLFIFAIVLTVYLFTFDRQNECLYDVQLIWLAFKGSPLLLHVEYTNGK